MNKTSVILAISSIFSINLAQADSAKLINPSNNHVYKRFDSTKTWTKAKASCTNQSGYLATVTSQTENDWLIGKSLVDRSLWLGATDNAKEGQWQWITGEAWDYTNWYTGQPNNYGNEDYLQAGVGGDFYNGLWNDWTNSNVIGYLCEWDKPLKTHTGMIADDTNNDGLSEFVLFGNNGLMNKVVSIDRESKVIVSEVDFSAYPTYSGVSLSVVDDMNGNGKAELALLLTKKSDGSSVIETRDSGTGELLESYTVPR